MNHKISKIDLSNGSKKGLLIHIPDATVMTFEINFRAGDYLVDHQSGKLHIMEHILLGANNFIQNQEIFKQN